MYEARISRSHPASFIILIDQSGSMQEPTLFLNRKMAKSEAVALTVNMLVSELLSRSKREDGYRNYFDIAVLGYHGEQVQSLWSDSSKIFMKPGELAGAELERVPVEMERRLPDGRTVVSVVNQKIWVRPYAGGRTPMFSALTECYRLCEQWCACKAHRQSYPPTIFNITDGESSDGDDRQLEQIAASIRRLGTEDGNALLINIHISSDTTERPVLFAASESELPDQRYARLLYRMSSQMPSVYDESIMLLKGTAQGPFRGISYNAGMTDLIGMMSIGTVSVNLLF